ncbi:hypothetical protein [Effusibacillus consociatus]|uniref:Uncharacterized protein n=1 Tax=Effusibacillus consociatus TaxID=1117041 RepID=A0ABV9PY55_9BACL
MKEILAALHSRKPIQSLKPKAVWDTFLDRKIEALSAEELSGGASEQQPYALAFKSGLHLWNDSLDKSHTILQDPMLYEHHNTGNYWHGIMHRMEGDYRNSRDWFEDLVHPVFQELNQKVTAFLQDEVPVASLEQDEVKTALEKMARQTEWNPYLFIDVVEMQVTEGKDTGVQEVLEKIQWIEMALLLRFTYMKSSGRAILDSI